MLKADAVDSIMQLDVDTEVIAVQLEFVARPNAAVFIDVELEAGDIAIGAFAHGKAPVLVLGRVRGKAHHLALLAFDGLLE